MMRSVKRLKRPLVLSTAERLILSRDRLIPDPCFRSAFRDLHQSNSNIEAAKQRDEQPKRSVECASVLWREDAAIEQDDRYFGTQHCRRIHYRRDVEPLFAVVSVCNHDVRGWILHI